MRISARSIFSFFLIVVVAIMVFLSFDYNDKARFFPLLFGGVTIILIGLQLLSDCFSGFEKRLAFVGRKSAFSKLIKTGGETQNPSEAEQSSGVPFVRVFRLFLWLVALTAALYFFNYVAVSVVFIFLLIALEAKAGWLRALFVALSVGIFIFALFGIILRVNFQV